MNALKRVSFCVFFLGDMYSIGSITFTSVMKIKVWKTQIKNRLSIGLKREQKLYSLLFLF